MLRLNRELEQKNVWVVIGYSFDDPVIQSIFLKKSSSDKHLVLVHPEAQKVYDAKFQGFKWKESLTNRRFGLDDFRNVNAEATYKLNQKLKFGIDRTPTPT